MYWAIVLNRFLIMKLVKAFNDLELKGSNIIHSFIRNVMYSVFKVPVHWRSKLRKAESLDLRSSVYGQTSKQINIVECEVKSH